MKMLVVVALVLLATAASAEEWWTDPSTGERIRFLESSLLPVTPPGDRLMLIGQTATDAVSQPFLREFRMVNLGWRPAPVPERYERSRGVSVRAVVNSSGGLVSVGTVGEKQGEEVHVNLKTMTYYVLRKRLRLDEMPWERVNEMGVCKDAPLSPYAAVGHLIARADLQEASLSRRRDNRPGPARLPPWGLATHLARFLPPDTELRLGGSVYSHHLAADSATPSAMGSPGHGVDAIGPPSTRLLYPR